MWTLQTAGGTYTCGSVVTATGYYDYDQGYTPDFKGMDTYKGEIVHAQEFDENKRYSDKNIIVIGR